VTLRLPCGKYRAGDHLEVLPPNDPVLVDLAMSALGLDGTGLVRWDMSKGSGTRTRSARDGEQALSKLMPVRTVTVRLVLEWFPDLAAVPARKLLAQLAEKATGDTSKASNVGSMTQRHTRARCQDRSYLSQRYSISTGEVGDSHSAGCALWPNPWHHATTASPQAPQVP